ncbi:MAG: hypothetical protein WA821_22055 [Anaerolineales bacterium]
MNRRSLLFSLWALQALIALAWLALPSTDTEHGFSASRLAFMAAAFALAVFSAALAWYAPRAAFTLRPAQRDALYLASVIAALLAPTTIIILRALGQAFEIVYDSYADKLLPLACWCTLSALELALWLAWRERKEIVAALDNTQYGIRNLWKILRITYSVLSAIVILIMLARFNLPPITDGSYGNPATPLLEWQILLALIASLIFMTFGSHPAWLKRERWMPVFVYIYTCLLWLSQPIIPGFFATPPRAPNFEIYPYSDALIYAQYAQSALAGRGFLWPDVPARPLYIAFLTWLHALAGQEYTHVIILQTLVLAAFPALLYLLGKELGGRPLGIGLALLAALRDLTANVAAPFALNYTYSKLFFSEIPAALLITLFTIMSLRWMRQNVFRIPYSVMRNTQYALLAGGILGLASLVRLQSAVLLLVVIPIGFFVIKDHKKWALGAALMALGLALAFTPWLVRNYFATGGLVLDNPTSQAMVLARRWSGDNGNDLIPQLPGENAAQYSSRMTALALQSLRQNPGRVLGAAAAHFINSEIDNLLVFPQRDQLNSPAELIWPQHAFWQNNQINTPVVIFYLFLLGIGLAAAWHKNGLPGLLPLGISLVYNAWTALFLSSGDRFLVPVDWAAYLYLFLGLLTLASLALSVVKGIRENVSAWVFTRYNGDVAERAPGPVSWRGLLLTAALILFLGASVPLTELAFPKIAPLKTAQAVPGEIVLYGRAIYPRWYKANDGEPGSGKLGYGKSNQARLVFFLVGEKSTLVIFPARSAPKFFPNASDVTITATQKDGFVQADKIVLTKNGQSAEYTP